MEFLADRSRAGRRRAPPRIVMARPLDWHALVHNLPGFAVLALAAGAGIWATRRFVAPARQIASVRLLFVFIVYYAVAGQALTSYMQDFAFAGDDPDLGLEALVRGTAEQPYVYRRLAPDIVHALSAFAALRSGDARLKANALEYLENILKPRYRRLLVPLLEHETAPRGDA